VQALKCEGFHDSALSRALLERAMNAPRIAHMLFWALKTDLGNAEFGNRIEVFFL
jgi:hypothetical protein